MILRIHPLAWFVPMIAAGTLSAQTSFIRQIQSVEGISVVSDIPVTSDNGQVTSGMLASDLSIFQLYTTYINSNKESVLSKLDEKSVGTFLPKVGIQITSEDPHVPTRTRADQPYTVTVSVSGLLSGTGVPDYAKLVSVGRGYKLYSPSTFTPTGEAANYADGWVYRANGTYVDSSVIQRLPVQSPSLATGSENYAAYILPGTGSDPGQLATAEVIVWPVAIATISGIGSIESGKVHYALPNEGSIELFYAYPSSTTYAQIYKGRQVLGMQGTAVSSTIREFNGETPKDATISIGSLADYIDEDGIYTIEVLTVTPFNKGIPERLAYVTFVVNRTIELNSMVATYK